MELTINRYVNGDLISEDDIKKIEVEDNKLLEIIQTVCNRVELNSKQKSNVST